MINGLKTAAVMGFTGVAVGAFGGHMLKDALPPDRMEVFSIGVLYHFMHTLALLVISLPGLTDGDRFRFSRRMFTLGVVLFSGSLYLLAITGIGFLGAITPLGGLSFMAGWLGLLWSGKKR